MYRLCPKIDRLRGQIGLLLYCRSLGSDYNLESVEQISRDDLERDLEFVALILFRNELKPDSRSAIEGLKAGEVKQLERDTSIRCLPCIEFE